MSDDKKDPNQNELVSGYIRTAWIFKIRMMSSRRQLWGPEVSKIHIESAVLQIRMACECIASMCLLLAELNNSQIAENLKKQYRPGQIFNALISADALNFPNLMRIDGKPESGEPTTWTMNIDKHTDGDISDVKKIWSMAGNFLHEVSPFKDHPLNATYGERYIFTMLEEWKGHHQWLWNRFWCHAVQIDEELFCIDLQSTSEATCPQVILAKGIVEGDIKTDFDAKALADFNETIIWSEKSELEQNTSGT